MNKRFVILFLALCLQMFALQYQNSVETLDKITEMISKKQKGAYLRFEEEVFEVISNPFLQSEINEAFALNGPTLLKCLPLHCKEFGGEEKGMFPGNHEQSYPWCAEMLKQVAPKWNGDMNDVYCMAALCYSATENVDRCIRFLKFLKQSKCCVFVGNCNIPSSIRDLLFGPQCQFVPVPARNVYCDINRIESECLEKMANIKGYKVVVTSMGSSGRVLQKRLWNRLDNVFLFDFDSLMDALCGWNTRDWISLTHFDAQNFRQILEKELADSKAPQKGEIRVVCTSALIPDCYDMRKEEYLTSFKILKSYGYPFYVFEACHPASPSFLEQDAYSVFYSNMNNPQLRNKGVNEARSMIEGFKYYQFNDDDMIIKLTGRYYFTSRDFFKTVEDHPEVDVFLKCQPEYRIPFGHAFTGCFAMRYKFFKEMLEEISLEKMEEQMIDIEVIVASFTKKLAARGLKVMYLDHLGMTANVGSLCPPRWTYW